MVMTCLNNVLLSRSDTCTSRDYAVPSELSKTHAPSLFTNPSATPPPPYSSTLGGGGGGLYGSHHNRGLSPTTNGMNTIGSPYACADVVNLPNTCIQGKRDLITLKLDGQNSADGQLFTLELLP